MSRTNIKRFTGKLLAMLLTLSLLLGMLPALALADGPEPPLQEQLAAVRSNISALAATDTDLAAIVSANDSVYNALFGSYTGVSLDGKGSAAGADVSAPVTYSGSAILTAHTSAVTVGFEYKGYGISSSASANVSANESAMEYAYNYLLYVNKYVEALLALNAELKKDSPSESIITSSKAVIDNYNSDGLATYRQSLINSISGNISATTSKQEKTYVYVIKLVVPEQPVSKSISSIVSESLAVAEGLFTAANTVTSIINDAGGWIADQVEAYAGQITSALGLGDYNIDVLNAALAAEDLTSVQADEISAQAKSNAEAIGSAISGVQSVLDALTALVGAENIPEEVGTALQSATELQGQFSTLSSDAATKATELKIKETNDANEKAFYEKLKLLQEAIAAASKTQTEQANNISGTNVTTEKATEAIAAAKTAQSNLATFAFPADVTIPAVPDSGAIEPEGESVEIETPESGSPEGTFQTLALMSARTFSSRSASRIKRLAINVTGLPSIFGTLNGLLELLPKGTAKDGAETALNGAITSYSNVVSSLEDVITRAENIIKANELKTTYNDIIQKALALPGKIASIQAGDFLGKYTNLTFGNADRDVNLLLDYLVDDLTAVQGVVNDVNDIAELLSKNPDISSLLSVIGITLPSSIDLSDIVSQALSPVLSSLGGTVGAALSQVLGDDLYAQLIGTLNGLAADSGISGDAILGGIASNIGAAINTIEQIKADFNFGDANGVQLQQAIEFIKSIADGTIEQKYKTALDIDSLKDVGALLEAVKGDVDEAKAIARSLDIIDGNLRKYLGAAYTDSAKAVVSDFLNDTLPGLVDGLIAGADIPDVGLNLSGIGAFVGQALGALGEADFDATGAAVEYLGYVSEALAAAVGFYESVEGLFTYDGAGDEYINGLNVAAVLDALGIERSELVAMIDGALNGAADALAGLLDNVGVDTYDVAAEMRSILSGLADSADSFAQLRKQAEGLYATLSGLYGAAEGYLTENEILDIFGDVLKYYGEDIEDAIWALLNGEGVTKEGVSATIANIAEKVKEACETLSKVCEGVKEAADTAKAIRKWLEDNATEDNIKQELKKLADALEAAALQALRDMKSEIEAIKELKIEAIKAAIEGAGKKLDDICKILRDVHELAKHQAREALDGLAEALAAKYPALRSLIEQEIDKIKAKAETALLGAWEELEKALEEFWQRPDVETLRHKVEHIAKTAYDGFDYAIRFIKANPNIEIEAAPSGDTGVHYTLSSNYDYALALPLFGIAELGSMLDLFHKLGLELEYVITGGGGAFAIEDYNKIVGTAAPGIYNLTATWILKYKDINGTALTQELDSVPVTITINPTVTFVDDNGNVLQTGKVDYGTAATAPTAPSRSGYTFDGWDKDFSNVTSDITVMAQYTIKSYKVTFVDHDGTILKEDDVNHGSAATAPAAPSRSGYTFDGWDKDFSNVTSDITVTAQYTAVSTGTVTGGGGGGGASTTPTPTPEPTPDEIDVVDEGPILASFVQEHIAYIQGYPDGSVRPDGGVTRAEVAMMIWRLLADAEKNDAIASQFRDVADDAWYAQAVKYLASIGILEGYSDGTFRPNAHITRAEFVTALSRFDMSESAETGKFSDVAGHWASGYISNAAEKGWTEGYPDGTFRPNAEITRAEAATMINGMLERGIDAEDVPDYAPSYTDIDEGHWGYGAIMEASYTHMYYEREADGSELWLTEEEHAAAEAAEAKTETDAETGEDTDGAA